MTHETQTQTQTLILGIGNVLWADEGFGVRAADALHRHYAFDDSVTVLDGGTQGIYLLQHVEQADNLLIFDAIDYGLEPGTLKLIEGADVPSYLGAKKVSLHQTGFQEVLASAEMLGRYPSELLLVGVQPVQIEDFGGSLHPLVRQQLEPAVLAAIDWLAGLGVKAVRRAVALCDKDSIVGPEMGLERYETLRPGPEEACRVGDERVLKSPDFDIAYRPAPLEPGAMAVDVDHRGKY